MAAIDGPAGPSMATKSAMDGPAGPVVAGDHLRHDRPSSHVVIVHYLENDMGHLCKDRMDFNIHRIDFIKIDSIAVQNRVDLYAIKHRTDF